MQAFYTYLDEKMKLQAECLLKSAPYGPGLWCFAGRYVHSTAHVWYHHPRPRVSEKLTNPDMKKWPLDGGCLLTEQSRAGISGQKLFLAMSGLEIQVSLVLGLSHQLQEAGRGQAGREIDSWRHWALLRQIVLSSLSQDKSHWWVQKQFWWPTVGNFKPRAALEGE